VQGKENHDQFVAWHKARAQARFRKEIWLMSFDEFQRLWLGYWHLRGRGSDSLCMTRVDPEGAWEPSNCEILERRQYLSRQSEYKANKRYEKISAGC
jgi:hypothetical protein